MKSNVSRTARRCFPLNLLSFSGVYTRLAYLGLARATSTNWDRDRGMDDPKALITVAGGIISNFLIFEIADSQNEDRLQGMYYACDG